MQDVVFAPKFPVNENGSEYIPHCLGATVISNRF